MKITKVEEQSIRLAVRLARHGEQQNLSDLAQAEDLSEALVAKILGKMRRGGLIRALRGRKGGYELAVDPELVTMADIIRSLDQPILQGCFNSEDDRSCPLKSNCGLRPVWCKIESQITAVLQHVTLQDLVDSEIGVSSHVESMSTQVVFGQKSLSPVTCAEA